MNAVKQFPLCLVMRMANISVGRLCSVNSRVNMEESKMKSYKYVNIHIGRWCGAKSEEHRKIIDQHAAQGYRYVGYIPTNISDYGKIKDMDLVFEMDVD